MNEPTEEQLHAIKLYAQQHGRHWKSNLRYEWEIARPCITGEVSAELQQLRNTLGPAWLKRFKLRIVTVRDRKTGGVVERIATTLTGSNYDKFLDGLYRKVDFDRFYVQAP